MQIKTPVVNFAKKTVNLSCSCLTQFQEVTDINSVQSTNVRRVQIQAYNTSSEINASCMQEDNHKIRDNRCSEFQMPPQANQYKFEFEIGFTVFPDKRQNTRVPTAAVARYKCTHVSTARHVTYWHRLSLFITHSVHLRGD